MVHMYNVKNIPTLLNFIYRALHHRVYIYVPVYVRYSPILQENSQFQTAHACNHYHTWLSCHLSSLHHNVHLLLSVNVLSADEFVPGVHDLRYRPIGDDLMHPQNVIQGSNVANV